MKKGFAAVLLALILSYLIITPALASATETPPPTPAPTTVPDSEDPGTQYQYMLFQNDPEGHLLTLKGLLHDRHYYPSNVPEADWKSNFFDRNTLNAVNSLCQRLGLPQSEYGIVSSSWYAINNSPYDVPDFYATPEASVTPSPDEEVYVDIWPTQTSAENPAINALQQHLRELGYDVDGDGNKYPIKPGVYDDIMRDMIQAYCDLNSYQWSEVSDNFVITAAMQETILNDKKTREEKVIEVETEQDDTPPGIAGYFFKKVYLFGIRMPNYVVWLISFALIFVVVFLVIHFFAPAGGEKSGGKAKGKTPGIEFTIEFNGKKQTYNCDIDHTLKIGRNVGNFPLDLSDTQISKKHCEIYYSNKILMIRDYSSNGTFVNGRACNNGEYALHTGDVIKIGAHTITVRF